MKSTRRNTGRCRLCPLMVLNFIANTEKPDLFAHDDEREKHSSDTRHVFMFLCQSNIQTGRCPAGVTGLRKHHSDKGRASMFICQSNIQVGRCPAGVTGLRKHHSDKGQAFIFICQSNMLICLTKSLFIPANVRISISVSKT